MLIGLATFIKKHFQRPNNGVIQLMLIHLLVFAALVMTKAVCVLLGYTNYYQALYQALILPASWQSFLQQPWSLLTYCWVHDQFWSLLWDMAFLYAFGQLLVSIWHSRVLKMIYLVGGIASGAFFLLLCYIAPGLQGYMGKLVGPAGSLYAVMVATVVASPHFYLRLLMLGNIKVKHIASVLLLLSCFELANYQAAGIAHLGGALIGYIYAKCMRDLLSVRSIFSYLSKIIRRESKFKITYGTSSKSDRIATPMRVRQHEAPSQEVVDAILEKIAISGYESLTQQEKQQLFQARKK